MTDQEPGQESKPIASSALTKLLEQRAAEREVEESELEEKRREAGYKSTEAHQGFRIPTKPLIAIAITAAVVITGIYIGQIVIEKLSPSWLIEDYEKALQEKRYADAATIVKKYIHLRPDDWDKTAEAGELLLAMGEQAEARTLFARLISGSPLSANSEILFLNALSNLPNTVQATAKASEILISLDSFVPSLVFRGLLDAQNDPEQSYTDFITAVDQVQRLQPNQEKHQRYQRLLALFTVTLCREISDQVDKSVTLGFDVFPDNLPHEKFMFIYGIEPSQSLNFCGLVPNEISDVQEFEPSLEALVHFYNAFAAVQIGDIDTANSAIGRSLNSGNLNVASFLDGVLLSMLGRFEDAKTEFQRTGGLKDLATQNNMSIIELLTGPGERWKDAETRLDDLLSNSPDSVNALNNRAILSMIQGRYGQARNDLNRARELSTAAHPAYNLSLLDYLDDELPKATAGFTAVSGEEDKFPGLRYYLGRLYGINQSTERSLTNYRAALDDRAYNVLANIALGDFYGNQILTYDVALKHYQDAYNLNNRNFEAAFKLAGARSASGEATQALDFIDDLADKFTDLDEQARLDFDELYLATRARILYAAGDEGAEEALRKATNEITKNDGPRISSAIYFTTLLLEKDDADATREALDITRTILPLSPQNIDLLISRANALAKAQDLNQALSLIDNALEQNKNHPGALAAKAEILAQDQRWDLAVEHYQAAFTSNPSDITPLDSAIELLETLGQDSPLLDELRLLKKTVLENQEAFNRLATGEAEEVDDATQRKAELKIELSERAVSDEEIEQVKVKIDEITTLMEKDAIDPFGGFVHLGALHTQLNQIDDAIKNMLQATKAENIPPEEEYKPWLNLSQLYILTSNFRAAEESLTKALEFNPDDEIRLLMLRAGVRERLDPKAAITDYDAVIERLPNQFDALYRRGINKLNIEDVESAILDFTQAIKIKPEAIEVYQVRRSAYGLVGERQKAAQDVEMINILSAKQNS